MYIPVTHWVEINMAKLVAKILCILGFLVQTTYGYWCRYQNRYGVIITVHCPYSECCGHPSYRYCCSTYDVGAIVGGVIGLLIFIGLIAGCVSCFFCACCPVYKRRRNGGYVITRTVPNYSSTVVGTTQVSSQPYQSTVITRTPDGIQTSPPPQYKP